MLTKNEPFPMQTIVIGHRNPDMDSICSAIGYAKLKQKLGMRDVLAARAGNTNERIDFVLQRFGVPAPEFVSDLTPKVSDLMDSNGVSVSADSSIYEAITSIEQSRLRGLPVVDAERRVLGLLSGWKISRYLFPPRQNASQSRTFLASISGIVGALDGTLLAGTPGSAQIELHLVVAAMSAESFSERLERYPSQQVVLFVGDREDILLNAVGAQVAAVVVTGGKDPGVKVKSMADSTGSCLISSRFDTATSVMLARGASRVDQMLDPEFTTLSPETSLRSARKLVADSSGYVFPVLDDEKRLVGTMAKSDFLRSVPRQLILVDHNELTQAVKGASDLPIIEVLDHHRLGGFSSDIPILFWNNPVGSTSTLVALAYEENGVEITPAIAGLLMAGLISDTLNLTSPTATPVDERILKKLGNIAGVTPGKLSEEIFSVGSPLATLQPDEVITADCKDYEEKGAKFSVSQVEELGFGRFQEKKETLARALEGYRSSINGCFSALLVTDVNTQNSLLLVAGSSDFLATIHFPSLGGGLYELAGVVSRKKQLVPYLLDCLDKVNVPIS
jgi:manganese-dependent inorganic pyrophosphatase